MPAPTKQHVSLPIRELRSQLDGSHACIAGSAVAAEVYDLPFSYDDIDIFCYGNSSLIAVAQHLMDHGFEFASDNESLKFDRWLAWDLNQGWRTNSLKLVGYFDGPNHLEPYDCNIVYKMHEKQPVKDLADVLKSFDFGVLASGYDLRHSVWRDARPYFFPDAASFDALPLLPDRHDRWSKGLVTHYTGVRQAGRAVKYSRYGYDMSQVMPVLVSGYRIAAQHKLDHHDPDAVTLGQIYDRLADHLEDGEFDKIKEADALLPQWRDVDAILGRLD